MSIQSVAVVRQGSLKVFGHFEWVSACRNIKGER